MSEPINDGGPAFPCTALQPFNGGTISRSETGMTLRDYFAGQALAGLYATDTDYQLGNSTLAKWSYETADAMLAAREGRAE